jgi:hypothetical protein
MLWPGFKASRRNARVPGHEVAWKVKRVFAAARREGHPATAVATIRPGVPVAAEGNGWCVYRFEGAQAASIVFNGGQGRQTRDMRRENSGMYRDAVTGNEVNVSDGRLSFHVRGNSAGIYVLGSPGKISIGGLYLR